MTAKRQNKQKDDFLNFLIAYFIYIIVFPLIVIILAIFIITICGAVINSIMHLFNR